MEVIKYVKSPLNYMGGKHKLLPQILPLFPEEIDTFYDLFGGGFNVGINVPAKRHVYNDTLHPVVKLLEDLYDYDIDCTLTGIDHYISYFKLNKTNDEGYYKLRSYYNEVLPLPDSYAFYTLICHSFNNQIRFNKQGEFNMPFGKNRSSFNPTLRNRFVEFVDKLQALFIEFHNKDFREFEKVEFGENDFVYCDPPYLLSTATYNENGGWTEEDEKDLYRFLDYLDQLGIKWALSNVIKSKGSTNTFLRDWAEVNQYNVHYLDHDYSNSNHQRKDYGRDAEVLITNY